MQCGALHDASQQYFNVTDDGIIPSPLANAFGMAICSSHDMFLINSGPKIPRKQTKTF